MQHIPHLDPRLNDVSSSASANYLLLGARDLHRTLFYRFSAYSAVAIQVVLLFYRGQQCVTGVLTKQARTRPQGKATRDEYVDENNSHSQPDDVFVCASTHIIMCCEDGQDRWGSWCKM